MIRQFLFILIPLLIVLGIFIYINLTFGKKNKKWKDTARRKLSELHISSQSNDFIVVKSSLLELDKLLEYCLRNAGFKGNTTGEMLKSANNFYDKKTYNNLWEAHKARNILVHEMEKSIPMNMIKLHYSNMETAIKKLL